VYLALGRHADSIEAFDTVATMTDGGVGLGYKGLVHGVAGQEAEARAVLGRLDGLRVTRYVSPLDYALVHAGLGQVDETMAALEQCREDRVSDFARVKALPWPDVVRRDPRFAALLVTMGLTP
jgi:hypothetical protein